MFLGMGVPASSPLSLSYFFDFACPWCYLGLSRLHRALTHGKVRARIAYEPYELYAHHDVSHRVELEKIKHHLHLGNVYAQISPLAAREGIEITQPAIFVSSRRALTGFLFARAQGKENEYMRAVFRAQFERGEDISSLLTLGKIAQHLGFSPDEFLRFVENPKHRQEVVLSSENAARRGVSGVPTLLIRDFPVVGAFPAHELEEILRTQAGKKEPPAFMDISMPISSKTTVTAFRAPKRNTGKKGKPKKALRGTKRKK